MKQEGISKYLQFLRRSNLHSYTTALQMFDELF